MSGSDRMHRALLLLIGIVALAAGLGGLLAGTGLLGRHIEHQHLYASHTAHFVACNGVWLWPVAAAVSILLALLALGWLKAQGTSPKARTVRVPSATKTGRTTIEGSALTSAVSGEIESYRGVRSAHVRLLGESQDARLRVLVTVEAKARVAELRDRIETEAVAHARAAMHPVPLPASIDFDVSAKTGSRV